MRTFLDVPMLDVRASLKNYGELLMSNEDGLLLRIAGGNEDILGTLNIDLMAFQVTYHAYTCMDVQVINLTFNKRNMCFKTSFALNKRIMHA